MRAKHFVYYSTNYFTFFYFTLFIISILSVHLRLGYFHILNLKVNHCCCCYYPVTALMNSCTLSPYIGQMHGNYDIGCSCDSCISLYSVSQLNSLYYMEKSLVLVAGVSTQDYLFVASVDLHFTTLAFPLISVITIWARFFETD